MDAKIALKKKFKTKGKDKVRGDKERKGGSGDEGVTKIKYYSIMNILNDTPASMTLPPLLKSLKHFWTEKLQVAIYF